MNIFFFIQMDNLKFYKYENKIFFYSTGFWQVCASSHFTSLVSGGGMKSEKWSTWLPSFTNKRQRKWANYFKDHRTTRQQHKQLSLLLIIVYYI